MTSEENIKEELNNILTKLNNITESITVDSLTTITNELKLMIPKIHLKILRSHDLRSSQSTILDEEDSEKHSTTKSETQKETLINTENIKNNINSKKIQTELDNTDITNFQNRIDTYKTQKGSSKQIEYLISIINELDLYINNQDRETLKQQIRNIIQNIAAGENNSYSYPQRTILDISSALNKHKKQRSKLAYFDYTNVRYDPIEAKNQLLKGLPKLGGKKKKQPLK